MSRASHAAVEIRRGYIAIVRPSGQCVVIRRQDDTELPDPTDVRSACEAAGVRVTSCSLILPRMEWLLGLGFEQKGQRAEALAAARLDAEVTASKVDMDVFTGVSTMAVRRGYIRPFWASLPRHRAEEVVSWATACGWDVMDLRCSPFEAARNVHVRGVESSVRRRTSRVAKDGTIHLSIVFYPGGEWELHGFHGPVLSTTYAGIQPWDQRGMNADPSDNFGQELFQALLAVCLQDLTIDTIKLELRISGQAPGGLDTILERMQHTLDKKGVTMTWQSVVEDSFLIETVSWPKSAVLGALARRTASKTEYPVVSRREQKGESPRNWQPRVVQGVAAVLLLVAVTIGLGSIHRQVADQLVHLHATTAGVQAQNSEAALIRQANEELQTRIEEIRLLFDQREQVLAVLFALDDALIPGASIETLTIDGEVVRVGVVAPSAVAVVERMQANPAFRDISMDSAVTVDRRNGEPEERVTIGARWDRGKGL